MSENDIKKIYWVAYTDVLAFLKHYLMLMDCIDDSSSELAEGKLTSDTFWNSVVNESAEIYEKHKHMLFVKNELINATKEIERIYKEKKEQ